MRTILILLLIPWLFINQVAVTFTDLENGFSLKAPEFRVLLGKKGFKLAASYKDPLNQDRDITMLDKGENSKNYSSVKKSTYNGQVCSVEYSSYLKAEQDNLIKQALVGGYTQINKSNLDYKKDKFIITTSSFPDFNGQTLYTTLISDQNLLK